MVLTSVERGETIREIVTRFPNLECGFLAALLLMSKRVRLALGITTGRIIWSFISTAAPHVPNKPGTASFNVGGGAWDQHGQPENRSLGEIYSLDLVRDLHDFLSRRPWLREVFKKVRANDVYGTAISWHHFHLRELMTGLTVGPLRDDPYTMLSWLATAFCGVFMLRKSNVSAKEVFNPSELIKGVRDAHETGAAWAAELMPYEEFCRLLRRAEDEMEEQQKTAEEDLSHAEERGWTAEVDLPIFGRKVRIVAVESDSVKTGPCARHRGYALCVQRNLTTGNVVIHGGMARDVDDNGEVTLLRRINLAQVAGLLRRLEAQYRGLEIPPGADLTATGSIDGVWYLPEFLTAVFNGTLSSRDTPATAIPLSVIFNATCLALPTCGGVFLGKRGLARGWRRVFPAHLNHP